MWGVLFVKVAPRKKAILSQFIGMMVKLGINSSGLPNEGYKFYTDSKLTKKFSKPYFVSVGGLSLEDNIKIIKEAVSNPQINGIELNL